MNHTLKKIGQGIRFALLAILAAYGVYIFSGLFMVILLAATAPITMRWESLLLDYTVWTMVMIVTIAPTTRLIMGGTNRYRVAIRAALFLLPFLIVGSLLIIGALLLPWPLWLAPAVPVVTTLIIMVGFYWYAKKVRSLILN